MRQLISLGHEVIGCSHGDVDLRHDLAVSALASHLPPSDKAVYVCYAPRDLSGSVGSKAGSLGIFLPVYSNESADGGASRFASVDVPAAAASCARFARARDFERLALMLPQDWRSRPLAQRLSIQPILPERVWLRVARWWLRIAELG